MKRILLFIDSLGAGGAQRQLTGLAVMLKHRGYYVKVITYYNRPFYKYILDDGGCNYECFNINSKLCLPKLITEIIKFRTDVLISFQTDPNALACIAAFVTRTKLIVSERNTHQSISYKDRLIFNLYRLADKIVPNSHSEGEFIENNFKFLKKKIFVISNFVDLNLFTPISDKSIGAIRRLLIVASVKTSKNTQPFIRAMRLAFDRGARFKVTWYGINPADNDLPENVMYAKNCLDMIKQLGMENFFRLLPKRTDIQHAYDKADIFCLPSLFEGTPNVICEAMSSALPVIASNVCDNALFVKEGYNGLLFNPNDVKSMSDALMRVYAMPDSELLLWGKRSRNLAEELCSEKVFVEKYIDLIDSI